MDGNVGLWASKNVRVVESNTRLEKWRATRNANTIANLIKIKVLLHQFWNLIITYIICAFKTKFRLENRQISFIVNH